MIIVDTELKKRAAQGNPVRVAMIGAGFMGRGIALQMINYIQGMELVAIANRRIEGARQAYLEAGVENCQAVESPEEIEALISNGTPAITENAMAVCQAGWHRRRHRSDRCHRIQCPFGSGSHTKRKACGADECRTGRHHRPDFESLCRQGRCRDYQCRWRPAGRHHELISVCKGHRGQTGLVREHQGASRSLSQSHHPGGLCQAVGAKAEYGHQFCRRNQDFLRAGHRRQCHRYEGCQTGHVRPNRSRRNAD